MNKKIELLLKRSRGRLKQEECLNLLFKSGFDSEDFVQLDVELFDKMSPALKEVYKNGVFFSELKSSKSVSFRDSKLLKETYKSIDSNSNCFIYSYDCQDCGINLTRTEKAFENILMLAKNDYQNTSYLIDEDLNYLFMITYNDENENANPCSFDIQLWKIC